MTSMSIGISIGASQSAQLLAAFRAQSASGALAILTSAKAHGPAASPLPAALNGQGNTKLDEAKRALATMTDVATAMRRTRSVVGKTRLQQLLEQVKVLRQMGGDPRAMARQAARLAKEIAAAAKEFSSGSIGGGQESAPTPATAPAQATNATAASATATAAATPDAGATASPAIAEAQHIACAASASTIKPAPAEGIPGADHHDERAFLDEVRGAVAALRSIIRHGASTPAHDTNHNHHREALDQLHEVDKADSAVDTAVGALGRDGAGELASGPPPSASAAPSAPAVNFAV